MKKPKTPLFAGLLGISLGFAGVHDFYSGKYKRAIAHLLTFAFGMILLFAAAIVDTTTLGTFRRTWYGDSAIMQVLYILAYFVLACTIIWGEVDGYHILMSGKIAESDHAKVQSNKESKIATPEGLARKAQKRKKLQLALGIVAGALVVIGVGSGIAYVVFHIDYGESYRIARDLRGKLADVYKDNSCADVIELASNKQITNSNYETYIDNCQSFAGDKNELINLLGDSSAIRKNEELRQLFETFQSSYQAALPRFSGLDKQLELYRAWHEYIILLDPLNADSEREDFQAAADVLIKTGNKTLVDFATEWLRLALEYRAANTDYWAPGAGDAEFEALETARDNYSDFLMNEAPDITEVADLDFDGMNAMVGNFTKLYNAIAKAYEEHYDYDSGDCDELYNKNVLCP